MSIKFSGNKQSRNKGGRPKKFTREVLEKSLIKQNGLLTRVAAELQCCDQTVHNYINNCEELKKIYVKLKKRYDYKLILLAKEGLEHHLMKKNLGAICFVLKTKGKKDGWSQQENRHGTEEIIDIERIKEPDKNKSPFAAMSLEQLQKRELELVRQLKGSAQRKEMLEKRK